MQHMINLLEQFALVYGQSVIHPFPTTDLVVCEPSSGYHLPEPDAYAKRLAEQAEAWLAHARERSRMRDDTLVSKALHSLAFSLRHRANDFAVPSNLSGTSKHQPVLWELTRERVPFGTPLDVDEQRGGKRVRLVVSFEGDELGEIQSKWVPVLRPLLPFGAGVFLTRVTGHEATYTLGLKIAVGRAGVAVEALRVALGSDLGGKLGAASGDGYGGDGPLPEPSGDGPAHHGGDGAAGGLRLASSAPRMAKLQGDTRPETDPGAS